MYIYHKIIIVRTNDLYKTIKKQMNKQTILHSKLKLLGKKELKGKEKSCSAL